MNRDDILKASRKENKNRDLAELDALIHAGNHASKVGALSCCLVSLLASMIAHTMLYSPWIIYFSIIGTNWLVRAINLKRKSDYVLATLFFILTLLALIGLIRRLLEVSI